MKTSFLRLTPALALIATLGLGAAQAQNASPAPATPASPALTKQGDAAKPSHHKKHADKTAQHKTEKKAVDAGANQSAKSGAAAIPSSAPKS